MRLASTRDCELGVRGVYSGTLVRLGRDELKRVVEEAERYASRAAGEAAREARERIVFAYSSLGEVAAWTAYWVLREVAPQAPVEIYSADALAFHVLAYRRSRREEWSVASDTTVYLFVGPGGENQAVFVRDAAVNTGAGLVVVASSLPPVIEERLGEEPLLVTPPGVYTLSATIFAARLAALLVERLAERNVRVERVAEETGSIAPVVDELLERHGDEARRVFGCKGCVYAHTATLRGPAAFAALASGGVRLDVQEALAAIASGGLRGALRIIYTEADEDAIRELRFRALTSGLEVAELRLRTDPVTAPVYAMILAHARLED